MKKSALDLKSLTEAELFHEYGKIRNSLPPLNNLNRRVANKDESRRTRKELMKMRAILREMKERKKSHAEQGMCEGNPDRPPKT